jgi:subtilisin family serine protease
VHNTYRTALKGFAAHLSPQAAAALAQDPSVAYVEPDQQFTVASTTEATSSWGLDRIDQANTDTDGYYTYSYTGAGVNVYIIDTGIRHTHVEFGARVVPAFSSIADAYGPDGCQWHGTHVAGIIGGTKYGVAKNATLYSVRAYDCSAVGTSSSLLAAVDWVTANRVRPAVANMSLSGPLSTALNTAVQNSIDAGVTYVVASGNNGAGRDACNYSPGSVASALTVASIEPGGDLQSAYANVGPCVDLYAPGSQILSAMNTSDTAFDLNSGTSQASAFVAGAAALYLQANPSATPADVHQAIISTATVGVVTGVTLGTPNRLLRVNGSGSGSSGGTGGSSTNPPVAAFSVTCNRNTCTFDASSSTASVASPTYSWSFGDNTSGSGKVISHTYAAAKTSYSVVAKLTLSDGTSSSQVSKMVTIKSKGR